MLNAFISTPLEAENVDCIREAARGRVNIIYEPDLLPPRRYVADHKGIEGYTRTAAENERFFENLRKADFMWDIPPIDMLSAQDMSFAPRLKWVQTTSSGVGPVVKALKMYETGIHVTTARGIHAVPLAEFSLMAMLMHFKQVNRLRDEQKAHRWTRYCGESLQGKLVAIVGVGEVGHHIAEMCKFHGMRVAAMSRSLTPEEGHRRGYDEVFGQDELRELTGRADVLLVCVPHTPETEHMIDRTVIEAIRPSAMLINIARGQVVDEPAMIEALRSGAIGFAALDVATVEPLPEQSPLWDLPNVMISPHSASTVPEENARITDLFIHNMNCMLDGRESEMRNLFDMVGMY